MGWLPTPELFREEMKKVLPGLMNFLNDRLKTWEPDCVYFSEKYTTTLFPPEFLAWERA
jgi:hypothetical protein